ncbi:MAG: hypothetical protein JWN34_897 [Bryobacterales bacterium]|nr:hypothetical protein [Bryobacterales bacterium]
MASAATALSVTDYLDTAYRPDRELIDGELQERNVGEYDHANLQGALIALLRSRQREWNVRVLPEQRLRVSPSRFRIPDVCIVSRDQAIEPVFTRAPLACLEVLSPSDTLASLQDRIDDYLAFGVGTVWVLDPVLRRAWWCTKGALTEPRDGTLRVAGTAIAIALDELFADLD